MDKRCSKDLFERPNVIKRLWIFLYVTCGATLIPDLFMQRESHFGIDGFFGFYALLGFISCVVLILVSKLLGLFLKVREDYYDEQ